MITGLYRRLAAVLLMLLPMAGQAAAQVALPYVAPEQYREHRWVDGGKIRFCTWSVSPTFTFDRRIAEEIGNALLLEVEVVDYTNTIPLADDNFWEEIYIQLSEKCDAIMGFALQTQAVPDWLTPTRAYYEGQFVLAVTNPAYSRLGDIPTDKAIGSLLYSAADVRLTEYLSVQPEDQRWSRFPFSTPQQQIDFLMKGTVEGSIFFAPTLHNITNGNPEAMGLRVIPLDPLVVPPLPVGMMLREHNIFLRTQLDLAIQSLVEDGVIGDVLAEIGMPGTGGEQP